MEAQPVAGLVRVPSASDCALQRLLDTSGEVFDRALVQMRCDARIAALSHLASWHTRSSIASPNKLSTFNLSSSSLVS